MEGDDGGWTGWRVDMMETGHHGGWRCWWVVMMEYEMMEGGRDGMVEGGVGRGMEMMKGRDEGGWR